MYTFSSPCTILGFGYRAAMIQAKEGFLVLFGKDWSVTRTGWTEACWELCNELAHQENINCSNSFNYMQKELLIRSTQRSLAKWVLNVAPCQAASCLHSGCFWLFFSSPRAKSSHLPEKRQYPPESRTFRSLNWPVCISREITCSLPLLCSQRHP